MAENTIEIPLSRLKRELNQLLRLLDRRTVEQIVITRRGVPIAEMQPSRGAWDSFFNSKQSVTEDFGLIAPLEERGDPKNHLTDREVMHSKDLPEDLRKAIENAEPAEHSNRWNDEA